MKHLKQFESFKEKSPFRIKRIDIDAICRKYGIYNYTINEDDSIDVNGSVDLSDKELTKIPLKFRNVSGYFYCSDNNLASLEGCPKSVGSDFSCRYNKLTSLEGCPESVGRSFLCYNNKLTSLEGCPKSVGEFFDCDNNKIATFEHLPLSIGSHFTCTGNLIWEIWKLFRDYSKIEFLNDCDAVREPDDDSEDPIVILDRLNFFLEEIGEKPVKRVKGYKCI
jgi:Leucine-rich repeat (LRR) protein